MAGVVGSTKDSLKAAREQIDAIDRKLLALINRRASLAQQVKQVKDQAGESDYYRPDREAAVRGALVDLNEGPLANEEVSRLFQEIMSACRALEQALSVAYLGPHGTFTEAAVHRHFGHSVEARPLDTIDAVFREVESGACGYGVVPVENSTEGVINHTLDSFVQSSLAISGEVELRIHHCLMSRCKSIQEIKRLYSHQQSLAQCRNWIDTNLPGIEMQAVNSNADAARRAAKEADAAAVAGKVAAEAYELDLLETNIEDDPNNTTRFLVIGGHPVAPSGQDKTSLLMAAKNRPGALFGLLEPLSRRNISMTRIESRPSRMQLWEYVFFVDFEGHIADPNIAGALEEMGEHASLLKVLGSYPRVTA